MEQIKTTIQKTLELMGFEDFSINFENDSRRLAIFINEGDWFKSWIPRIVSDLNHLSKTLSKKAGSESPFIDVNNYRKEREHIITEIAKAAARKVIMTKSRVDLPAMNAYERRLIHVELASRPDVATESEGEGDDRHVVIKPLE